MSDVWGAPLELPVQAVYGAGDVVTLEWTVTTAHHGHAEASVCCEAEPTADCLDAHPLAFVKDNLFDAPPDPAFPGRGYLAPVEAWGGTIPVNYTNGEGQPFSMDFRLPAGVEGDRCLLQWRWVTSHMCSIEGYDEYFSGPGAGLPWSLWRGSTSRCPSDDPERNRADGVGAYPEKFWNCADVTIVPAALAAAVVLPLEAVLAGLPEPEALLLLHGRAAEPWAQCGGVGFLEPPEAPCDDDRACLACDGAAFECLRHDAHWWSCRDRPYDDN